MSHLILEGGHAAGKARACARPSAYARSSSCAVGVGVRSVPWVGPQVIGLAVGLELHSSRGVFGRPAHTGFHHHISSMQSLTAQSSGGPMPYWPQGDVSNMRWVASLNPACLICEWC